MLIAPNEKTTAELNYAAVIPHGWEKEPYRLYALRQLEIIDAMPSRENVISEEILLQLIIEEYGSVIIYETGIVTRFQAWGKIFYKHGYPIVVLDKMLERPNAPIYRILKRTTLAHELGHILLHRHYLENGSHQRSAAYTPPAYMCDIIDGIGCDKVVERLPQNLLEYMMPFPDRPGHRWTAEEIREFQANQIMVGLMLPCINLRICVANFLRMTYAALRERYGWGPCQSLRYNLRQILEDCAKNVARAFDVSKQMAAIEIGRLFHSPHDFPLFMGQMVYPKALRIQHK